MKYDFETLVDRTNLSSSKWNQMMGWNPTVSKGVVPLSVADMELKNSPEIIDGLKKYLDEAILGYTDQSEAYTGAVKGWMKRRHNWEIKSEWIVCTPGVVNAFFQAVRVFTEEGDGVILMTPVYYPMYSAINSNNREVVSNPLIFEDGKYTIDFDDLEKKCKDPKNKIILFSNPHNPVGRVWTKEELEKVGRICIDNNVLMVSDEIHFDLVMPGYKHIVYANISEEFANNCIVCTAPSKTFNLAGLQASNIIIPNPEIRKKFEDAYNMLFGHLRLNILSYKACEIAYNECEEWLEQFLQLLERNRDVLKNYCAKHIPQIKFIELEGTYLQWMDFREFGLDNDELERVMHMEAEAFFDEGYVFGEAGSGFERINLACPTKVIEDLCVRMEKALKKYM